MKTKRILQYGIVINIHGKSGGLAESRLAHAFAGNPKSAKVKLVTDSFESLILAQACAGIDIESPKYVEALQTTIDAVNNNHFD